MLVVADSKTAAALLIDVVIMTPMHAKAEVLLSAALASVLIIAITSTTMLATAAPMIAALLFPL